MSAPERARCPIVSDNWTQRLFRGWSYNARAGNHRDRIARPIWPTRGAICDRPNNGGRIAGPDFCPDLSCAPALLPRNATMMALTRPVLQTRLFRFIRLHSLGVHLLDDEIPC